MSNKYLFYITQNYSFEILRPLQEVIVNRGDQCAWFVAGEKVNLNNFNASESRLSSIKEVLDYNPVAVFVPGNEVPDFIPGFKIQVFHGLEHKKKGHFRIRDCFHLYCTQGEIFTSVFEQLAQEHKNFHVVETGWSKLDPLFSSEAIDVDTDLPVVLYAPTFSPNLTSALACFDVIQELSTRKEHYWLVKFHPKMNSEWMDMYKSLETDNFKVIETDSSLPLLQRADVMLSDTSSMVGEFLLLNKPVVTYNNSQPGDYLINVLEPKSVAGAIANALTRPPELMEHIAHHSQRLHPYTDGMSSQRVLGAVDQLVAGELGEVNKLPLNLFRNIKIRKLVGYLWF